MARVESVEVAERWVYDDLSASMFDETDRSRVLDDLERLEAQLVTWDRALTSCVDILRTTGSETVYRRRVGDLRTYFIRRGSTLVCIGVGKRRTVDDRELDRIVGRATELDHDR